MAPWGGRKSNDGDRDAALTQRFLPLRVKADSALTKSSMIYTAVRRVLMAMILLPGILLDQLAGLTPLRPRANRTPISNVPKLFR